MFLSAKQSLLCTVFSIGLTLPFVGFASTYYCPTPGNIQAVLQKASAKDTWEIPANYQYGGLTFIKSDFYNVGGQKPLIVPPNLKSVVLWNAPGDGKPYVACNYYGAGGPLLLGAVYAYLPEKNCHIKLNGLLGRCIGTSQTCQITCDG